MTTKSEYTSGDWNAVLITREFVLDAGYPFDRVREELLLTSPVIHKKVNVNTALAHNALVCVMLADSDKPKTSLLRAWFEIAPPDMGEKYRRRLSSFTRLIANNNYWPCAQILINVDGIEFRYGNWNLLRREGLQTIEISGKGLNDLTEWRSLSILALRMKRWCLWNDKPYVLKSL